MEFWWTDTLKIEAVTGHETSSSALHLTYTVWRVDGTFSSGFDRAGSGEGDAIRPPILQRNHVPPPTRISPTEQHNTPISSTEVGPRTLLEAIRALPNQSLWAGLDLDGNGDWILDALRSGTLVVAHDGRRLAKASCAERTMPGTAGNYRGELIGGLLLALIMHAAGPLLGQGPFPVVEIACDNMGVVGHGKNRDRPLKDKQKQADLIRCFRAILAKCTVAIAYAHVYGHQDDKIPWDDLTLQQQLNVLADKLAKDVLDKAVRDNLFISSLFPFESFRAGRKSLRP
eukprot:scaffold4090_cov21-Cyclotella_meneghiniana.AAC.1